MKSVDFAITYDVWPGQIVWSVEGRRNRSAGAFTSVWPVWIHATLADPVVNVAAKLEDEWLVVATKRGIYRFHPRASEASEVVSWDQGMTVYAQELFNDPTVVGYQAVPQYGS